MIIQARERLMKLFEEMISSRRSSKEPHEDFLQSMLERDSFPDDDEKLDDSEIMDNMLTLIIAGQTTTAAAMMWSVKFLDENKDVQNMLRVCRLKQFMSSKSIFGIQKCSFLVILQEEQLIILRNKPKGALLSQEDLNKMSYCSKVTSVCYLLFLFIPIHLWLI